MTEAERERATFAYMDAHAHEWAAWRARPSAERNAILEKIDHTMRTQGILAGRAMSRALGMPTIPDELCDPVEVLEAQLKRDADEAKEWDLNEQPMCRLDH